MSNETQPTKVIIGPVLLSFLHVWEPQAINEGDQKKYSVSLIIPKKEKKMIAAINAAIEAAKEAGKAKWGGKIPTKLDLPLRDGDVEKPDLEEYADSFYISAKSNTKPGVVDKNRKPIMDQEELYSGCFGYVSVNFYPYDVKNKGVACGLNNIMKSKDGTPLSGRASAEDDFAELVIDGADEDGADDLLGG